MSNFIIGIGTHAGSVWLANLLSAPECGVLFENEQLTHLVGSRHWSEYLRLQLNHKLGHGIGDDNPTFEPYFEAVRKKLKAYRVYGDFNSWSPPFIPAVCQALPVTRIIGIMRHGIQQLYSLSNSYIWTRVTDKHPLVAGHLQHLWETSGSHGKPWEERTLWEKKCEMWASTVHLFDWLKDDRGLPLEVHRLEMLTTYLDYLKCLMYSFAPDRHIDDVWLLKKMKEDINRKVWVDRTPINLWRRWTEEQQRAFNEICGDGMRWYGYEILEVGA